MIAADATTQGTDPLGIVAMMDVTTEDHQIAVATLEGNVTTAATSDALSVGHAVVITARAKIDVTIAHAEIDATKESIAVEAPTQKEAVMKRSVPDLQHTAAGAKTAIQVNNNNKNRWPHNPSDTIINQDFQLLIFAFLGSPRREDPEKGSNDHFDKDHRNDERENVQENGNHDE